MGITLQQIADLAGTHKSTVDKVIHNRPGVSEKKRREIRALLEEYGYEANPLAKALNYQKKKGVAVIFVGEDLDVLLALCDRILVLSSGRVSGIVDARTAKKEEIGLLMTKSSHQNEKEEA